MKSLLRVMFPAAIAGFLVATSAVPSGAVVRAAKNNFDGIWSVSIVTSQGDCNRAYRYPLRIWYGRVVKADGDPNYMISGAVARSGHIAVTVSGGGQTASGTGRLRTNDGEGIWRSANGQCSGHWTATRREDSRAAN
jgi:hypothetical protein